MVDDLLLSEWIMDQLNQRNWSRNDLAKRSGLGRSVISKTIRQLSKRPDPETLSAIAVAFDEDPITVFRIAKLLPPDTELPELESFKHVLKEMSPENRQRLLDIAKVLLKHNP